MIKQLINVDNYWRVIVYYNVDYTLLNYVKKDIKRESLPVKEIDNYLREFITSAKAVTISLHDYKTSIVIFKRHKTDIDYINSITHEAEHIKDAMFEYYCIRSFGEPPAYTIGFLVAKMYMVFKHII